MPERTFCAATFTASSPDAQNRLSCTPGHGVRQPGGDGRGLGDVAALVAERGDHAEHDVVDRRRVELREAAADLVDQADDQRDRLDLVQRAGGLAPAARGADGVEEVGLGHLGHLLFVTAALSHRSTRAASLRRMPVLVTSRAADDRPARRAHRDQRPHHPLLRRARAAAAAAAARADRALRPRPRGPAGAGQRAVGARVQPGRDRGAAAAAAARRRRGRAGAAPGAAHPVGAGAAGGARPRRAGAAGRPRRSSPADLATLAGLGIITVLDGDRVRLHGASTLAGGLAVLDSAAARASSGSGRTS